MSNKEKTWRDAIDAVLSASPTALHYQEITERIISQGLRTSLGATPAATVNAQISTSIDSNWPFSAVPTTSVVRAAGPVSNLLNDQCEQFGLSGRMSRRGGSSATGQLPALGFPLEQPSKRPVHPETCRTGYESSRPKWTLTSSGGRPVRPPD